MRKYLQSVFIMFILTLRVSFIYIALLSIFIHDYFHFPLFFFQTCVETWIFNRNEKKNSQVRKTAHQIAVGYRRCKKIGSSAGSIQGQILFRGYVSSYHHLYIVSIAVNGKCRIKCHELNRNVLLQSASICYPRIVVLVNFVRFSVQISRRYRFGMHLFGDWCQFMLFAITISRSTFSQALFPWTSTKMGRTGW